MMTKAIYHIFFVAVFLFPLLAGASHTSGEVPFPPEFVPTVEFGCSDTAQESGSGKFGTGLKGFTFAGHCFISKKNVGVLIGASAQTDEQKAKNECQLIPGAHWFDRAAGANPPGSNTTGFCFTAVGAVQTIGGALGIVNQITNWLVAFLIIFGVFYGIIGAYEFLSSGGEDKKLTAGKKKIYYAVGGVALGLLVKGIITLLVNFVGTLGA